MTQLSVLPPGDRDSHVGTPFLFAEHGLMMHLVHFLFSDPTDTEVMGQTHAMVEKRLGLI